MHPKVVVRTKSQENQNTVRVYDWSSMLSLKDVQFLSLQESCFPELMTSLLFEKERERERHAHKHLYQISNWVSSVLSCLVHLVHFSALVFLVKERQDVSSPAKARIPKAYVRSMVMPTVHVYEEADTKNNCDHADKQIRVASIPRPRAVVSSPDNDEMIGNKNKIKAVRPSVLANHNSSPSRHARCKVIPSRCDKRKEWI